MMNQETSKTDAPPKKVFWIVKTSVRFCWSYISVFVLCILSSTIIGVLFHVLNKNIVNELAANASLGKADGLFFVLVTAFVLLYLFQRASGFLITFGKNFYRLNVSMLFQKIFMWRTYQMPQEKFFDTEFMEKYSFAQNAVWKIDGYIAIWMQLIFGAVSSLVGTVVLFAVYEPWMILNVLIITVVTVLVYSYVAKKQYELDKKQVKEQRFADYYRSLLSQKEFAKELRLYETQEHFFGKWLAKYGLLRKERLDLSIRQNNLNTLFHLVQFVLRVLTTALLAVGAYFGRYDIGTFVMLFGLIETASSQVFNVTYNVVRGAYKEVKYLCDYYDYVTPVKKKEIQDLLNGTCEDLNEESFGEFRELSLENVSYTYPNANKPAVDGLSMTIKRGEIVSILGYNGSGKTTLSKLMIGGLLPQFGTVKLNGTPITVENRSRVLSYFGVAPQEFSRFSLQIREIVGLGNIRKMQEEKELRSAYDAAEMSNFLKKYPPGDRTVVGKKYDDTGVDLSGGEWQKLVIASCYMGQPPVLIMDEPTASIDPLKEMEYLQNFRQNLAGRTAILISHRIGFARLADRIIMMENGKIIESGTHTQLLEQKGYYAKLFYEQKKLYEGDGKFVQKNERADSGNE